MKRLLLAVCLLLSATGCHQLLRFEGAAYYNHSCVPKRQHPYRATKSVYSDWFLAPARLNGWWGLSSHDPIGTSWMTILWPVGIVDLPCEVVCDTVFLVPDLIFMDHDPRKEK